MTTKIDLYEALKGALGADEAQMVVEAVYRDELATKDDLARLEARLLAEMRKMKAELESTFKGWLLTFFVPLWLTMLGLVAAVIFKS